MAEGAGWELAFMLRIQLLKATAGMARRASELLAYGN
jgi:hypothetical protein